MKVALPTIDFEDVDRRGVRAALGRSGLATRAECVAFALEAIENALESAAMYYDEDDEHQEEDDELFELGGRRVF